MTYSLPPAPPILAALRLALRHPSPPRLSWIRRALALAALFCAGVGLPGPPPAQSQFQTLTSGARACAPRDVVLDRLAEGYGETRKSIGLGSDNAMIEVFASDDSGTWTITVTSPQGITCLIASGQAYERLNETLPGDDQDA
ncbi:hypothetical protein [Pseudooceanicola sp. 200-1SW]|uniref:hypothetical protein n=1 Tax=Pseudooceanicola sp. 200-1SW TaxID=3425949 RepID=UPI003D7F19AC